MSQPAANESKTNTDLTIGDWVKDYAAFSDFLTKTLGYTLDETFAELGNGTNDTYFSDIAKDNTIVGKIPNSFQAMVNDARKQSQSVKTAKSLDSEEEKKNGISGRVDALEDDVANVKEDVKLSRTQQLAIMRMHRLDYKQEYGKVTMYFDFATVVFYFNILGWIAWAASGSPTSGLSGVMLVLSVLNLVFFAVIQKFMDQHLRKVWHRFRGILFWLAMSVVRLAELSSDFGEMSRSAAMICYVISGCITSFDAVFKMVHIWTLQKEHDMLQKAYDAVANPVKKAAATQRDKERSDGATNINASKGSSKGSSKLSSRAHSLMAPSNASEIGLTLHKSDPSLLEESNVVTIPLSPLKES